VRKHDGIWRRERYWGAAVEDTAKGVSICAFGFLTRREASYWQKTYIDSEPTMRLRVSPRSVSALEQVHRTTSAERLSPSETGRPNQETAEFGRLGKRMRKNLRGKSKDDLRYSAR
jgi:hypothetical protein